MKTISHSVPEEIDRADYEVPRGGGGPKWGSEATKTEAKQKEAALKVQRERSQLRL